MKISKLHYFFVVFSSFCTSSFCEVINVGLGGAQKKSKPGYFFNKEGEKIVQYFVYQEGPYKEIAKGLKVNLFPRIPGFHLFQVICEERFGVEAIFKKKHCDLGEYLLFSLNQPLGQFSLLSAMADSVKTLLEA